MTKSKKIKIVIVIALVLAVLIGVGFFVLSKFKVSSSPTVGIITSDTAYGQEGYFTIYFDKIDEQYAAFDISLQFDPSLIELVGSDKGDLVSLSGESAGLVCTTEAFANTEGKFVVVFVDSTGGDNPITSPDRTDVAYVRYKTLKPHSQVDITISEIHFSDVNGEEISTDIFKIINGGITVE